MDEIAARTLKPLELFRTLRGGAHRLRCNSQ